MRRVALLSTSYLKVALLLFAVLSQTARGEFQPGEYVTYAQQSWGSVNTPASQLLAANIDTLYPNGVEIGIPGAAGSSALFTTLQSILDYLPQSGAAGPLDNDYLDATTTSSGSFGGYVLALQFNVDLSDAGLLTGGASLPFGDLVLFDTGFALFDGLTVRQYLEEANSILGGVPPLLAYEEIASLTDNISLAFENGTPSEFAQGHFTDSELVAEPSTIALLLLGMMTLWKRLALQKRSALFGAYQCPRGTAGA